VTLFSTGGTAWIKQIEVAPLESIWKEKKWDTNPKNETAPRKKWGFSQLGYKINNRNTNVLIWYIKAETEVM
jgi:hypothetical protein